MQRMYCVRINAGPGVLEPRAIHTLQLYIVSYTISLTTRYYYYY